MTLGFSRSDAGPYAFPSKSRTEKEGRSRSALRESRVSGRNERSRVSETNGWSCASSDRVSERAREASDRTGRATPSLMVGWPTSRCTHGTIAVARVARDVAMLHAT